MTTHKRNGIKRQSRWLKSRRPGQDHPRLRTALVAGVVFFVIFGLSIWFNFWMSSRIRGMSTISAQTEFIRFTVTQPHQVNISARGLRMGPEGRPGRCIEGDIEPVIHANVEYRRVGAGPLSARLVAPPGEALVAILQTEDGHTLRVTGTTYLQTDKACAGRTSSTLKIPHSDDTYTYPLPIWGDVSKRQ